jgi:hypothetical protein
MERSDKRNKIITMCFGLLLVICGCNSSTTENDVGEIYELLVEQNPIIEKDTPKAEDPPEMPNIYETDEIKENNKTDLNLHIYKNTIFNEKAPQLIEEFKQLVEKYDMKKTNYNLIKAIVSGSFLGSFQLDEEDAYWVEEKREYLANQLDSFSVVYIGASSEGLQFVAIITPMMTNSFEGYSKTMGQIRGDDREVDLLAGISFLNTPHNYFAVDVYVKDVLDLYDEIKIHDFYLSVESRKKVHYISERPESPDLEKLLNEYNRDINVSDVMKENDWNLYLFEDPLVEPTAITIVHKGFSESESMVRLTKTSR